MPLDELEIHLREEIELQIKSGLSKQRAFEAADQKLGQAGILKDEFKNKNKYIGQKFISNAFLISSVSSLFMLLAQFWRPPAIDGATLAKYLQSGKTSVLDLYATFGGGAHHLDFILDSMNEYLALSLALTALFALLRFRLSKQSGEPRNV
ncbi:MAG TPA: hypothetical protein VIK53_08335 [Verrucomicrobiae bacterium]